MSTAGNRAAGEAARRAEFIRRELPRGGLFAGQSWRLAPAPFPLGPALADALEKLGRVLLQFYRAANLLYRQSLTGRQPAWVAELLDRGKPASLLAWQRHPAFKNDLPQVLRPDLLLTEAGLCLTELDSVPGGIGATDWLNQVYSRCADIFGVDASRPGAAGGAVIGGADGIRHGMASLFQSGQRVHCVISAEAGAYRPEMEWLAGRWGDGGFQVRNADYQDFQDGDAVYRFFELFDLANVPAAEPIFRRAAEKKIRLTPPPKPLFEEKLLLALLWNRNLREFWRRELGASFFERLQKVTPYTWVVDPAPLPPHAAIPELNLTDWRQLKELSQRERQLVLKISGYSELAWGARGLFLGADLANADWSAAVDRALASFATAPYVLQRYHKPRVVEAAYFDFDLGQVVTMPGRVRLCPYYFVAGENEAARARLGGVLATICPADKKIIHGMSEAILCPCVP